MKIRAPFVFENVQRWTNNAGSYMAWALRPVWGSKYGPRLRGQHRLAKQAECPADSFGSLSSESPGDSEREAMTNEDTAKLANAIRLQRKEVTQDNIWLVDLLAKRIANAFDLREEFLVLAGVQIRSQRRETK